METFIFLLLYGYWARVALVTAAVVAFALDFVTTRLAIRSGAGKESNPVVRFIIDKFGFNGFAAFKAVSVAGLLAVGMVTQNWVLIVLNAIYWPVVINNYRIYKNRKR